MTDIIHSREAEPVEGSAEYFTGRATIRAMFARDQPSRITGALVSFEPGARTAWHLHPLGQTLIVTDGVGWTQLEDGPILEFRAGDVLLCPADRRHWHGATPDTGMAHYAIQEALDGTNVVWMEHVPDDVYRQGPGSS